jgi:hypothetical protein
MTARAADPGNGEQSSEAANRPTRIVIDTNVWLRYLIKPSAAIRELIETWWLNGQVQIVVASDLLSELEEVLARPSMQRFVQAAEGQTLLETIRLLADVLPALGAIPGFTRDRKDDMFIACALAGQARFVVTADEDLLVVGEVEAVRMITPHHFVAWLRQGAANVA